LAIQRGNTGNAASILGTLPYATPLEEVHFFMIFLYKNTYRVDHRMAF
jgi:hypothetical protein